MMVDTELKNALISKDYNERDLYVYDTNNIFATEYCPRTTILEFLKDILPDNIIDLYFKPIYILMSETEKNLLDINKELLNYNHECAEAILRYITFDKLLNNNEIKGILDEQ